MDSPHTMHFAEVRANVLFNGGPVEPLPISKSTGWPGLQSTALSHRSDPFRLESQNEEARGAIARHAGLGHRTVRAQSQARTVPPSGAGGYRWPTWSQTWSRTRRA